MAVTGAEDDGAQRRAFIISPIGKEESPERRWADQLRKHVIDRALADVGLTSYRSDDDATPGSITPQMIRRLVDAPVVVADLTGRNPNCYYELGVAHAFGRPTVTLVSQITQLPFDVKDLRMIEVLREESETLKLGAEEAELASSALAAQLQIALKDG